MSRVSLLALALLMSASIAAADEAPKPKSDWDIIWEKHLMTDFGWLTKYHDDDVAVLAQKRPVDVVFMGDSITELWLGRQADFWSAGRIDRGISGQTTPQMLVRFREDVIELHPKVVHIMAGTNDIAENTGPMTIEQTEANLTTMAELAKLHGMKVVFGSVLPASYFFWHKGIEPADMIRKLNRWIKDYAAKTGAGYADYYAVVDDGKGGMRADYSEDGVHPNEKGYAAMRPVAEAALAQALKH